MKKSLPLLLEFLKGKEEYIKIFRNYLVLIDLVKLICFDGKTGDKFDRKVTVGYIYMLKLHPWLMIKFTLVQLVLTV